MGILTEHADQDNISREVTFELSYEDISIGPNIKRLQGQTACSLNYLLTKLSAAAASIPLACQEPSSNLSHDW